jgi:hypothetical protein
MVSKLFTADLAALPKQAQLLLAHCLEQDSPDLQMMTNDPDSSSLESAGWLVRLPCPTLDISCFRIRSGIWQDLRSSNAQFMSETRLADLHAYRCHKTAAYPWVW